MSKKNSDNYTYLDSDIDSDSYENALVSSLIDIKKKESQTMSTEKEPTEKRIDYIKNIIGGSIIQPMVNFDNCTTETTQHSGAQKKIINFEKICTSMNLNVKYIKSGSTGHTFMGVSKKNKDVAFAMKVCAYPKGDDYGELTNKSRPENVELRILKLLSYFVVNKKTPHLVIPVGSFNTQLSKFINIPSIDMKNKKNELYLEFIEKYKDGKFNDLASVLICEWSDKSDMLDYIRNNYKNISLLQWKVLLFQIIYTLAVIHDKYPAFRHNDMKANNILINTDNSTQQTSKAQLYLYTNDDWNKQFLIPNIGIQAKIWDFDFACVKGLIENNKVNSEWAHEKVKISNEPNKYYDIHYLLNTLSSKRFFPEFYKGGVPKEIVEFVERIVPEKYRTKGTEFVTKKGRLIANDEYTTPYYIIMNDVLFKEFKYSKSN